MQKVKLFMEKTCIACKYSGNDESQYQNYGCPSCTCRSWFDTYMKVPLLIALFGTLAIEIVIISHEMVDLFREMY